MNNSLILAIVWTVAFITDIVVVATGSEISPITFLVAGGMVCVLAWERYFTYK